MRWPATGRAVRSAIEAVVVAAPRRSGDSTVQTLSTVLQWQSQSCARLLPPERSVASRLFISV